MAVLAFKLTKVVSVVSLNLSRPSLGKTSLSLSYRAGAQYISMRGVPRLTGTRARKCASTKPAESTFLPGRGFFTVAGKVYHHATEGLEIHTSTGELLAGDRRSNPEQVL